jgi:hypothetical protein
MKIRRDNVRRRKVNMAGGIKKKMEPAVELNEHEEAHGVKQSSDGGDKWRPPTTATTNC